MRVCEREKYGREIEGGGGRVRETKGRNECESESERETYGKEIKRERERERERLLGRRRESRLVCPRRHWVVTLTVTIMSFICEYMTL